MSHPETDAALSILDDFMARAQANEEFDTGEALEVMETLGRALRQTRDSQGATAE